MGRPLALLALSFGLAQLLPAPTNIRVQGILTTSSTIVTITTPTSGTTYDAGTSATLTTLAGTAQANKPVSACTWTNSLGGSGSASGTSTWTVASIALTVGDNVITVTCPNAAGTGTDVITVTRAASSCTTSTCIYIAQASAGAANGSTCADARAMTYLETAANWGGGGLEIDAGDTVYLCGTITESTILLPASGSAGTPVIINGSNATLSTAVGFNTGVQDYLTLQALTWADGPTNTLVHIGGASVSQNIIIENLYAENANGICVHVDQDGGAAPVDITFRNSFCRTDNTDYGDTQHDIIFISGVNGFVIEGNYLELRAGGSGASAHDDVIQSFKSGCGGCTVYPTGIVIRYNKIVLNSTFTNDRSWTVLENLAGNNYIYGNIFLGLDGGESANGLCCGFLEAGSQLYIYNNTLSTKGGSAQNIMNFAACGAGATINVRNNIFYLSGNNPGTGSCTYSKSYNHWFGTGAPSCASESAGCVTGTDPLFTSYASNDVTLTGSSTALNAGSNFGSPWDSGLATSATWCTASPCTGTITTLARGTTWDKGAYEATTPPAPDPAWALLRKEWVWRY